MNNESQERETPTTPVREEAENLPESPPLTVVTTHETNSSVKEPSEQVDTTLGARFKNFFEADDIPVTSNDNNDNKDKKQEPIQLKPDWYYWIFFASGFAGIIYVTIWARYLTLFLGYAAHTQVLLFAMISCGLALGAILCVQLSQRLQRPLLWYSAIHIILALMAVYFHNIFAAAQSWAVHFVLPQIELAAKAEHFKWLLAAVLLVPPSMLLGATFPLISSGLVRLWPEIRGRVLSCLYFSNVLGAVFGGLVATFILLPVAGLPGSIAIAGFINTIAAAVVWVLGHLFDDVGQPIAANSRNAPSFGKTALGANTRLTALVTAVAFGSGLTLLVYETVWLRMLSTLFGSSSYTLSIIGAVFIFGLALGGWYASHRADKAEGEILTFLGKGQIAIGVLALLALICLPLFYDFLNEGLATPPQNQLSNWKVIAWTAGLSSLMILPATFYAGTTFPLLTRRLLDSDGEEAIGRVYAAGLLGAAVGALISIHLLLPFVGLKQALLFGVFINMLLGVTQIGFVVPKRMLTAFSFSFVLLTSALLLGKINPQILAAGVFNSQSNSLPKILFYREGKTTNVAVTTNAVANSEQLLTRVALKTNGQTQAELIAGGSAREGYTNDEQTMTLLGLLPLLYKPGAKQVMNIGFQSGLTARALLLSRNLKQLDNVEAEAMKIEGGRHLGNRIAPIFEDPRNRFIIDDARALLTKTKVLYDVIVSHPKTPWNEDTASLLTREFYQQVRGAMPADGIFVQSLSLETFTPRIAASVLQAMAEVFNNFNVYLSSENDIIVVASMEELPQKLNAIFASDEARTYFSDYHIRAATDTDLLLLGNKKILLPYFSSFNAPTSSDYYPYVANEAAQDFFHHYRYSFGDLSLLPVPVLEFMGQVAISDNNVLPGLHLAPLRAAANAHRDYSERLKEDGAIQLMLARISTQTCPIETEPTTETKSEAKGEEEVNITPTTPAATKTENAAVARYLQEISGLVVRLMPVTDREKMAVIWQQLAENSCIETLLTNNDSTAGAYTQFWRALALRDGKALIEITEALLPHADLQAPSGQILLLATMAAHYQEKNYHQTVRMMLNLPLANPTIRHAAQLLAANAAEKI